MAKLVDVFRFDKLTLRRRQLPLMIDENLTMVMDLNTIGLIFENNPVKGKALEEFMKKYNVLTPTDISSAFEVPCKDLLTIINQIVPCVGCRRSVERLFCQLIETGHEALDPLVFTPEGILTIKKERLESPQLLCSMLHDHSTRLSNLVESQTRSKKSHRCNFHSLESHRTPRTMSGLWRDVWDCMRPQCKEEVVLIESQTLLLTLETYLRKHRFCGECRTKVMRAYTLLTEDPDPSREKGYSPALYAGIKRCLPEKHIHLQTRSEYIGNLITRADLELMGSRRERHAKTLEIAQEEVLTCLGLCVYERLYRIHLRLREEECTCQVLAGVAIEALNRNFETAVEVKQGVSQLELLFEQITKEELAKQQKKEHKKQKRKKKKERKAGQDEKDVCECESEENGEQVSEERLSSCNCLDNKQSAQNVDRHKLQVLGRKSKGIPKCYCKDCRRKKEKGILHNGNVNNYCHTQKNAANIENYCHATKTPTVNKQTQNGKINHNCCPTEPAVVNVNNNLVSSPPSSPPDQFSLSPCQSCKNAQDFASDISKDKQSERHVENGWVPSDNLQDCGYSSENNGCCDTASGSCSLPSSPEGSEVACSDGFCNHEGECVTDGPSESRTCGVSKVAVAGKIERNRTAVQPLTLQQMLEESCSSDDDVESYIPAEDIQAFKARMRYVTEQRQELRQTLRKRFDLLCVNPPQPRPLQPTHCASN